MKKFFLLCLALFVEGGADYVVAGGYGSIGEGSDAPEYIVANQFSIGQTSASSVATPTDFHGQIASVAVDSYRGTVIYVGQDQNNTPFIFRGSVVSSEIVQIPVPSNIGTGSFYTVAIDSDGNAIIAGQGMSPSPAVPLIYRLPVGATAVNQISIPNANEGQINSVAIAANNTAVLGGYDLTADLPLILVLPSGANQAIPVSLNDPSPVNGFINAVAVGPNGTAIFGGANTTVGEGEALIYSLAAGSLVANPISIPDSNDGGMINDVAIGPDGTAILAGFVNTPAIPLIYRVPPGGDSATLLANADDHEGTILCVGIGSDGTAILGGSDGTTFLPLIYKLAKEATQATSVASANAFGGAILSLAIGSQDVAALGGSYFNTQQTLLFTLPIADNIASSISTMNTVNDIAITGVAIYSYNGLYDIRRLRPYYYLQQSETITKLNQAGRP